MADRTKIEWADATWNPIRGCTFRIGKRAAITFAPRLLPSPNRKDHP